MKKSIGILSLVVSLLIGCESGERREIAKQVPTQTPIAHNVWGGKTFPLANGCVALKGEYIRNTVMTGDLLSQEYGSNIVAKAASEFLVKSCAAANSELSCENEDCLYVCVNNCMAVTMNQLARM